ncbi:YfiT family bacillithiol transferase [Hyunsoonleella pacifica]|uniref:Putative metal-dependent hydrolase n=1 Tax=Hyunsoonleella pacifica TaxID=1080224 RepID=A0A4Q9FRM6_9FLAO|nr:putative metal-dependent hydrolase [Hyunsoonleella pacifica]TBN18557.1 putative metal-dependent hydrolase [Hyunsoonleella pacifica]GGD02805.1 putative metal-dependent hydrolase YfiT [Hyunsoonleella pacifica]
MDTATLERLKYPIGQFECPEVITKQHVKEWIDVLETFPIRFEALVKHLNKEQLDTPYRPGGWTIRQTVHHVSDSHHHSYTRFKWALTEDKPLIKAYEEKNWAELFDSKTAPIQMSLEHLKAIHYKLVYLLRDLSEDDFKKSFLHPETNNEVFLDYNIGNYAWHSKHHYAHIEHVMKQKGWM